MNVGDLVASIQQARISGAAIVVDEYRPDIADQNEFLLFLKPELTGLDARPLTLILERLERSLTAFDVSIVSTFIVTGRQLIESGAMREHYGVIDNVSRRSMTALSPKVITEIKDAYPDAAEILGGHQFLEKYPEFSGAALTVLYENLASQRFAGGVHGAALRYRGSPKVLLNGFHPDQIDRYERPETTLLVLICRTATAWRTIRQSMLGGTNPSTAELGSLRREVLTESASLGLDYFNSSMNGFHASAGPLEASVEIARFYSLAGKSLEVPDTSFGMSLHRQGSGPEIGEVASNPLLESELGNGPAFDVTEEEDASRVLSIWPRVHVVG